MTEWIREYSVNLHYEHLLILIKKRWNDNFFLQSVKMFDSIVSSWKTINQVSILVHSQKKTLLVACASFWQDRRRNLWMPFCTFAKMCICIMQPSFRFNAAQEKKQLSFLNGIFPFFVLQPTKNNTRKEELKFIFG